ncbi:16S rRNA (guanine(966)-N(2))-methyltransferase RsmD [Aquabacterium sp. UBA2148]|uniref:16S rRNA (guanine(966)-N(2))-methyltransferase RsmD n=1 Tax=Aquabacterium sp. UBA2148 TaxID=1946042 RepID=UPI002580D721|nr:16S rRNA (guanine(966)-N(2))-methyltransferase RsmD [Aquabacterium sp. UBA2148]
MPPRSPRHPRGPADRPDATQGVRERQARSAQRVAASSTQEVRLIGGRWKRTPLPVPVAAGLRPTPARVRETLFNWLGQDLSGWRVLDAFAGSGALGLEAASRGAERVTLVERDATLVRSLKAVVQRLTQGTSAQPGQRLEVLQADALSWMPSARQAFDLVLLDPPFDEGLFDAALDAACTCVPEGGWIYVEAPHELGGPASTADAGACAWLHALSRHRHGQAGAVHFHLFRREAFSQPAVASTD